MQIDALIPARGGSKRILGKNFKEIGGHPLLAYTILAARESGIFRGIYVCTDSEIGEEIAMRYGGCADVHRRASVDDMQPDYEWVRECLEWIEKPAEYFAILRPTAPFRQPETIRRAWRTIQEDKFATGLKAVSPVREHPGKMWRNDGPYLEPLMNWGDFDGLPSYECPTQVLPTVYVQNASLDIALARNPLVCRNVLGAKIIPFYTHGWEGFDINTQEDWLLAEKLIEIGAAQLPVMGRRE